MPDFGVIQFLPYDIFQNPDAGLTREELSERRIADIDDIDKPPPPPSFTGWPRAQIAKHRGDLFIIETSGAGFRAMLRFSPQRPDAGDYEIHHGPHGPTEKGCTYRVREILASERDERASMLTQFPIKYVVFTTANDRAKTRTAWRIGLTSVEEIQEDDT
jgi:hypothetical protein